MRDGVGPGCGGLIRVGRADDVKAGNRAKRGEVLDRLMGRSVFSDRDGVMAEHEDASGAGKGG